MNVLLDVNQLFYILIIRKSLSRLYFFSEMPSILSKYNATLLYLNTGKGRFMYCKDF